jgi:hypothetical protein
MPTLKIAFNKTTNVATVLDSGGSVPVGSDVVGTFEHPDATYPDSYVIYHGVREILYKRSAADPSEEGFWPGNITDMQKISIVLDDTAIPIPLTEIVATPTALALSVEDDATNGKTVTFAAVPADAVIGTLSIKTAPDSERATATITSNVLTVKPVAPGDATSVVVTNGTIDVTVNITVAV